MNIFTQACTARRCVWFRGVLAVVFVLGMALPFVADLLPAQAQTGAIGDFVWHDANGDGIQDIVNEPGIGGITVNLLDGDGNPVLDGGGNPFITMTDGYGRYQFTGLLDGDYIIEFVAPAGAYTFTLQSQGGDPDLDSDADPVTGRTAIVTLVEDATRTDIDAGFVTNYCDDFFLDWDTLGFVPGTSALQTFTNVDGSQVDVTTEFRVVDENYNDLGLYIPALGQPHPQVGSSYLYIRDINATEYPDAGRIRIEIVFSEPVLINDHWFEPFYRWIGPDVNKQQAIQAFDHQGNAVTPLTWSVYGGSDLQIEAHPINGQNWLRSRYDNTQTNYSGSFSIHFGDQPIQRLHLYSWGEDPVTGDLRNEIGSTFFGGFSFCVSPQAEIWVTKTGSASPVTPGEPMTYSLTITNDGPSNAENVVVTDTLPSEVTFVSADPPQASGPNPLVWNLGTLTPGESRDIVITVTVNPDVTAGFTNTVIITTTTPGDDPGNNEDDYPVDVLPDVEIWVTKTGSTSPVTPGEPMTYSLTITNDGPSDAENVVVTDTLPSEVTFVSAAPPQASGPNPLVWTLGTLTPGESRDILITVTVNPDVTAGFTNTVIITTTTPGDDPGNNEDDYPVAVATYADLAITKSDSPDPVVPGETLVYTLVYTNYGPSDAENVIVTDTLPAEVTFVNAAPYPNVSDSNPLVWNLGNLAASASGQIVITVTVNSDVTAPFTNTVVITSDTPDDNPDNNTDDEPTSVLIPGMELVKTVLPGAAVPNMPFTYVITITNTGYVTLDPLILTDTLPSLDFHYVVGTATPAEPAVIAPPLLVWPDLGPLDPGASISVTFAVTVTPGLTLGTYVNVALATGNYPTGILTDTDDVPIVIEDPAIALSKHLVDFDNDIWAPNFVTYTIAITNVGLSEIDILPLYDIYDAAYLHFAFADPVAPNTVDNVNGQIVWFDLTAPAPHGFGRNLLPGESFTLTTVFTVVQTIGDVPVTNTAVVSGVIDIYNNPTPDEEDEVVIVDIPTAVDLMYFRAVAMSDGIRLEWATAVEIDNFGFTLHRATEPDFTRASEIVFIPSACRGNLCGATYDYLDTAVNPDVDYWFWLVDVDTSGVTTRHGPVSGRVSSAALPIRIFLPLVLRNR